MSSVAAPSPMPRRLKTPSWLDLRLLLGVAMVLGAVSLGAFVVSRAQRTSPVVAAARTLAAGTVLTAADLDVVRAQLSARTARLYARSPGELVGRQLRRDVRGGELITLAAADAARPATTLTVPLPDGAAPALHAGERIEVWVSSPWCRSVVLLPDVTVQSAHALSSGFSGSAGQAVVIRVGPALAERVVSALDLDQAHLRAGVLSGPTGASRPAGGLIDLAACASTPPATR
jgi:hypothetical protein